MCCAAEVNKEIFESCYTFSWYSSCLVFLLSMAGQPPLEPPRHPPVEGSVALFGALFSASSGLAESAVRGCVCRLAPSLLRVAAL